MPFNRPTLTELTERARADIEGRLPGADSRLRRSVLDVLARVHSGALSAAYGLIDWVWRQIFPDTAEGAQLARWAAIWGVTRKGATPATGNVTLTGTNGSIVPIGTPLLRADAVEFTTDAAVTIAGGTAVVAVTATVAGVAGNGGAGQRLTFVSPIAGVNAVGTVAAGGLSGGADEETDEPLRDRMLTRIQQPPHGGNAADYERWALEVPGVTRAWVYPGQLGVGTVTVAFVIDGRADIIPTGPEVAAVAAHLAVLRPVTANVTVIAPVAEPIDFSIRAIPPTSQVENAIVESLTDLFRREAEPGGTILISHVREAISLAAGEMDHEVIVPNANFTMATGDIATVGAITFVA